MQFKVYKSILFVKKYWTKLTAPYDDRVYQSYGFNYLYEIYRKSSFSAIKAKNTMCRYIVGFEDGNPVCIAPIAVDKTPNRSIHILGHGTNAGYLDFIYNDDSYVENVLEYLMKLFKEYTVDFLFVKGESPISKLLRKVEVFRNYNIPFHDYKTWFGNLSKSTRQNIRTAYNRMKTDNVTYEIKTYTADDIELKNVLTKCNDVYQLRKLDWNGQNSHKVNLLASKIYLKRDIIYKGMRTFACSKLVVLRINNEIAAFFIGFSYSCGILIPRLAIDTQYARYSPGIILISEYLKSIQTDTIYNFDLCRGDESYKIKLGGRGYETYRLM